LPIIGSAGWLFSSEQPDIRQATLGSGVEPEGMRHSRVRKQIVLAVLLLVCAACQAGTPQAHSTPKPSASASATPDAQRCARLAKRGFTPCPPLASQLKLPPTTIKNATNGAVDDATVQKWGRAYQLAQAYYYWAMDANARSALTSDVLADPTATDSLFGADLEQLDQAKQEGGTLVVQFLKMPLTQVVVIPVDVQDAMRRQGHIVRPDGIVNQFVGPGKRAIRYPDGHEKALPANEADFTTHTLIWGELKSDPDLGDIWCEYGVYGCDEIKKACQI
jgi:hypothetical protein